MFGSPRLALTLLFTLPLTLLSACSPAEENKPWNGKRAAIVLTYDDSLHVHLDKVIPALNTRGLHGTFYLTVNPSAFSERVADWRTAAQQGHELGNHTLFHPCKGSMPGREWVNPDYDLNSYSVQRMVDEIVLTNRVLETVDGLKERTFAYTCGDIEAGGQSFVDAIRPHFIGARGVANNFTAFDQQEFFNINAWGIHEQSAEELIAQAQLAIDSSTMLVYLFHGVGGEHPLNVSLEAHNALLDFLVAQQEDIWVPTFLQAVKYMQAN